MRCTIAPVEALLCDKNYMAEVAGGARRHMIAAHVLAPKALRPQFNRLTIAALSACTKQVQAYASGEGPEPVHTLARDTVSQTLAEVVKMLETQKAVALSNLAHSPGCTQSAFMLLCSTSSLHAITRTIGQIGC